MTLRERFIAALTLRGEKLVKSTPKSLVYTATRMRPGCGRDLYFYIGKSGSIRLGETKAKSVPLSDRNRAILLANTEVEKKPAHPSIRRDTHAQNDG